MNQARCRALTFETCSLQVLNQRTDCSLPLSWVSLESAVHTCPVTPHAAPPGDLFFAMRTILCIRFGHYAMIQLYSRRVSPLPNLRDQSVSESVFHSLTERDQRPLIIVDIMFIIHEQPGEILLSP